MNAPVQGFGLRGRSGTEGVSGRTDCFSRVTYMMQNNRFAHGIKLEEDQKTRGHQYEVFF